MTREDRKVILASSVGTILVWYDFYLAGSLYDFCFAGSLVANTGAVFFSGVNPTASFIFALLAFAASFAMRPFGALLFGRLGDRIGRKSAFLATMILMGVSTLVVGLLPTFASIGLGAPVLFIACRLIQGLALGGAYGGAATYVAERAPRNCRGFYTSWIQVSATAGLLLALIVILALRFELTAAQFSDWGWRVPFLLSILLLAVSTWIRLQLAESPAFQHIKDSGTLSRAPLSEAFGRWPNVKLALFALLGGTSGQAAVWYTGQFYALFFLTETLKLDATTSDIVIAVSLAIGTPFFVLFGWLSDKIGRKPVILLGCLLAAVSYFPLFRELTHAVNPALEQALVKAAVTVYADPKECSFQFDPTGTASFATSCDVARSFLARHSVNYASKEAPGGALAQIKIGDDIRIRSVDRAEAGADGLAEQKAFEEAVTAAIREAGYPAAADKAKMNMPMTIIILTILVIYATMVYGPLAAMLVELFPTRIRYSAISLPYHVGNGWVGGLLPVIAFAFVTTNGDIYAGLWYPVVIAAVTFLVGVIFVPEIKDSDIYRQY